MPRRLLLPLLLALLAPALRPQVALPDLVARMEAAVGAAAGPSAGDWVLTGSMTSQGLRFEQVISIRSEPFCYREELRWLPPTPDAVPPAGVVRHAVYLSDGQQSWNLADELGPAGPLTDMAAVGVLDNALLFRLLLDPRTALGRAVRRPPRLVTGEVKLHDAGLEAVHVEWPHGTSWIAAVEPASGRLAHLHDAFHVTGRWYVPRAWQALEGGATFPLELEAGMERNSLSVVRYASLTHGQVLPPGTFPRRPVPPLAAVEDVASLRLAHGRVPGALSVIVPEGQVTGGRGSISNVWTLIDTGAIGAAADPGLAQPLGLPLLGRQNDIGLYGGGQSDWLWIDRVRLGRHPLLQIPASTPPLPGLVQLPREHPVGLVLGGPRLMELSPVLDLRARRLLLRGPLQDGSVRPLSEIAGQEAFTVPLVTDDRDCLLVDCSIGGVGVTAMLDTGFSFVARLSRADMRSLGLSLDADEWLRRGALRVGSSGVHGHAQQELLVRLDRDLRFGPVTLLRPLVILMNEQMEGAERAADRTLLGMGALSAFSQVGFDRGQVLELVAPDELLQPGDPARVVIPAVEDPLGFELQPADLGATARPHNLPHVRDVLPGMAGERAGLRDGDFLAEVDGLACDGVPPMDLWERLRLRGRKELRLAVLREDARVEVVIEAQGDG